jgi:hypothetical protein
MKSAREYPVFDPTDCAVVAPVCDDLSDFRRWVRAMNDRSCPWHIRLECAVVALNYQLRMEDAIAKGNAIPIDRKVFMNERDKTTALMWLMKQHLEMNSGPRTSLNE